VELHHQAIVDAHAGELDQHVAGEAPGLIDGRLAAKAWLRIVSASASTSGAVYADSTP